MEDPRCVAWPQRDAKEWQSILIGLFGGWLEFFIFILFLIFFLGFFFLNGTAPETSFVFRPMAGDGQWPHRNK